MSTRLSRRNRTEEDLGILHKGGFFDLFDNAVKEIYRINDVEYDYLSEHISNEELEMITSEHLTYAESRKLLKMLEMHLRNMVVIA